VSGCRNDMGKLFHILGHATRKLLSSSRVWLYVYGIVRALVSSEQSWQFLDWAIERQLFTRLWTLVVWRAVF